MSMTFKDIQDEVARRATRDKSGGQFTTAIKNVINSSLMRLAREDLWRQLRRTDVIDTITSYTTGSGGGTFTNGSKSVTVTGATFLSDNIQPGRRISLQGSNDVYVIKTITGETTLTIDKNYEGTTISGTGTYSILGQEEYLLPINATHRVFIWHEEFGHPYQLTYVPEQDFYFYNIDNTRESTPTHYRMWTENMVSEQLKEGSVISISSSSTADTSIDVNVYGTVNGLPDYETITTNASDGTTASAGSKSFTHVERIVKSASTVGVITATANSGNTTIVKLPIGDTTAGIMYRKIKLYPLPDKVIPLNVNYYKQPYRLVNDDDVHELGQEFDEAIVLLATSKMKLEQNQQEGEGFFQLYINELASLKKVNADKLDWFPTLGRSRNSRRDFLVHPHLKVSQFGSNFGVRV